MRQPIALACLALLSSLPGRAQSSPCQVIAIQEAELVAPSPDSDFGTSIAIDGDWCGVSGRMKGAGSFGMSPFALFQRDMSGNWTPDPTTGGGGMVDMSAGRALLGQSWSSTSAYVYELTGGLWNLAQVILYPGCPHDDFSRALSLQGDVAAIGVADVGYGYGWVEIYGWNGTQWVKSNSLSMTIIDAFGQRVDLDGQWVVAGGLRSAAIFDINIPGGNGTYINPTATGLGDGFGEAVAVSGDWVAVSAPWMDGAAGAATGRVFTFFRQNNQWLRGPELTSSQSEAGEQFGMGLSMDGTRLLVGAPGTSGAGGGSVYVFERNGQTWTELGRFQRTQGFTAANFGVSVDFEGERVVVGSSGSGFAFRLVTPAPPASYCTAGTTASGCTAELTASGTPSASLASGFTLTASDVEGKRDGTIYFGTGGAQANPWGNGTSFQCVTPPTVRTGVLQGSGTAGACDNVLALDLNAWWAQHPGQHPGPGTVVYAQCWFRDPGNGSNQDTSLSEGFSFTICP